jgi:CRISPR/Cas system-associated exonuclease Cas4 (RecB family)
MTLPEGFHFSQSNLQDYLDCQRRFQLRYLLHVAWPALETQPASENENTLQLGAAFHYLIRQHQSGVPVELLTASIQHNPYSDQNELSHWWENYLTALETITDLGGLLQPSPPLTAITIPEISLSVPLGGFRLIAKFDLLVFHSSGTFTIIDWKTNRVRPPRRWLQERMQSRIYLYTLVKSGMDVNEGKTIEPKQVEMLYWFTNFPTEAEHISYSTEQLLSDEIYILDLINKINQKREDDFSLTHNEGNCRFCVYRSLCDRGTQAGSFDSFDQLESEAGVEIPDIHMAQIDEIEF